MHVEPLPREIELNRLPKDIYQTKSHAFFVFFANKVTNLGTCALLKFNLEINSSFLGLAFKILFCYYLLGFYFGSLIGSLF